MLRILRLREALVATVSSPEFINLKAFKNIATLILNPHFWKYFFLLSRAIYTFLRILRLGDCKTPGMDKLLYYVLQADCLLPMHLKSAEEYGEKFLTEEVTEVLDSTNDLASIDCEAGDDEYGELDDEESEKEDEAVLDDEDDDKEDDDMRVERGVDMEETEDD